MSNVIKIEQKDCSQSVLLRWFSSNDIQFKYKKLLQSLANGDLRQTSGLDLISNDDDDDDDEDDDDDDDEEDDDDDELDESSSSEESISPVTALMALIFSDKPVQSETKITVAITAPAAT